jgi:carbon storage regulator
MLQIGRRVGESIMIGDNVRVEVLEIRGKKVRLGFDAPREVAVNRREVWLRIQQGETNAEGEQADAPTESGGESSEEPDPDLQV